MCNTDSILQIQEMYYIYVKYRYPGLNKEASGLYHVKHNMSLLGFSLLTATPFFNQIATYLY